MGILNRLQLWWNWLTTDPLGFALYLLYFAVSVLLTLILHEIAHGYVAYRCGDPTAKMLGRLSLDPRRHLDPLGTLCLVFLGFGWAKPVPVNPRNFKGNYRRDDFLVSVAGITVNLTLFILWAITTVTEWRRIHTKAVKKVIYAFTFPLFMFTYIPISFAAIFCKGEWKPIEHRVSAASLRGRGREELLPF